jgi:hypothetical protein
MKQIFKKITILLLSCLCLSPISCQANAPYLRGWAGASCLHDHIKDYEVKYRTGMAYGAAFGYAWPFYLKTEVEALYFHNDIKEIRVNFMNTGLRGGISAYAALFNVVFEYPLNFCQIQFSPYLGAGVGASYEVTHLYAMDLPKHKDKERRFAYQCQGGLSFPLYLECLPFKASFNLEGRYLVFDEHVRAAVAIGGLSVRF